jgi:hypothetical protein
MTTLITASTIKAALRDPRQGKRYDVSDSRVSGLQLRVKPLSVRWSLRARAAVEPCEFGWPQLAAVVAVGVFAVCALHLGQELGLGLLPRPGRLRAGGFALKLALDRDAGGERLQKRVWVLTLADHFDDPHRPRPGR